MYWSSSSTWNAFTWKPILLVSVGSSIATTLAIHALDRIRSSMRARARVRTMLSRRQKSGQKWSEEVREGAAWMEEEVWD